jgi:hypothetical protein
MVSRMPVPSSTQRVIQTQVVDLATTTASACPPRVRPISLKLTTYTDVSRIAMEMIWTVWTVGTNQLAD